MKLFYQNTLKEKEKGKEDYQKIPKSQNPRLPKSIQYTIELTQAKINQLIRTRKRQKQYGKNKRKKYKGIHRKRLCNRRTVDSGLYRIIWISKETNQNIRHQKMYEDQNKIEFQIIHKYILVIFPLKRKL